MRQVDMREGPNGKRIVLFSFPLFLTYLIQLLYHTTTLSLSVVFWERTRKRPSVPEATSSL